MGPLLIAAILALICLTFIIITYKVIKTCGSCSCDIGFSILGIKSSFKLSHDDISKKQNEMDKLGKASNS